VPVQKGYRATPLLSADLVLAIATQHPLAKLASTPETQAATLTNLRRVIAHDTSLDGITRSAGLSSEGQRFYVQNMDQKVEAILAGIGVGHLPRRRIQTHLDQGRLIGLDSNQTSPVENFLAWKLGNKGKGLQSLTKQFTEALG
jgi:DNA-binding transcriptional LysR family regulator|tara:strand:- start:7561 stop:7992 length:432 start_codon:yes stop_codon:yes gene_type:complete